MAYEKEMTALNPSVAADEEQSNNDYGNSITDYDEKCNSFEANYENDFDYQNLDFDEEYVDTITMNELYNSVYGLKPPIVEGLLNSGVYLFVGAPKLGKSFLMAQLAYHVSTGIPLWKQFPVRQSTVLYFALEDDYCRLQRRMYKMFGTETTDNLHFAVDSHHLGDGLCEQIQGFINRHRDTRLIIIDTLQKVRDVGSDYSYQRDYEFIAAMKEIAEKTGVCIILVHHTRKQKSDDSFDMISGTNGLLGAADGAFILQKEKRTSNKATLDISGRDQQDQRLELVRNAENLTWELVKAEVELWKEPPEPLLVEIAKHITPDCPKWQGTATDLAALLHSDLSPNALTKKLNVIAGRLLNEFGVRYETFRKRDGRFITLTLNQV